MSASHLTPATLNELGVSFYKHCAEPVLFFSWWLMSSLGGSHNKALIVFSIITASLAFVAAALPLPAGGDPDLCPLGVWKRLPCLQQLYRWGISVFSWWEPGSGVGLAGRDGGCARLPWEAESPSAMCGFRPLAQRSAADTATGKGPGEQLLSRRGRSWS